MSVELVVLFGVWFSTLAVVMAVGGLGTRRELLAVPYLPSLRVTRGP